MTGLKRVLLIMALAMCLGNPGQAWAAETYPVYIRDVDMTTEAIARGGVTYLPMRTLFESCQAAVDWDGSRQLITAVRLDGAVLELDMRRHTAAITEQGQTTSLAMPQRGFIQNGVTYLPLRFVAENLHCEVKWEAGEKRVLIGNGLVQLRDQQGQSYLVDLSSGGFYRGTGSSAEYLGDCGIAQGFKLGEEGYARPESWQLAVTAAGNYLLRCSYDFYGSMIHTIDFAAYMNFAAGQVHFNASEGDLFLWQEGDEFSLVDAAGYLVTVDDRTGEIRRRELATMLAGVAGSEGIERIVPVAVDGDYIFFRSNLRTNLLLFDTAAKELVDLQEVLITDEVMAATGRAEWDEWWQNFGPNKYSLELGPYFHFVKLADGVLYVELRTYMDFVTIPLEYRYK